MPRKYQRESALDTAREKYGAAFNKPLSWRFNPRQRLMLVYIGILTFSLFLLVFHIFQRTAGFSPGDLVFVGTGVIVEKRVEPGETGGVRQFVLEVEMPEGPVRAVADVPEARHDALAVGDRVAVRYRLEPGGGIRVVQTGAVALPEPIE